MKVIEITERGTWYRSEDGSLVFERRTRHSETLKRTFVVAPDGETTIREQGEER